MKYSPCKEKLAYCPTHLSGLCSNIHTLSIIFFIYFNTFVVGAVLACTSHVAAVFTFMAAVYNNKSFFRSCVVCWSYIYVMKYFVTFSLFKFQCSTPFIAI